MNALTRVQQVPSASEARVYFETLVVESQFLSTILVQSFHRNLTVDVFPIRWYASLKKVHRLPHFFRTFIWNSDIVLGHYF